VQSKVPQSTLSRHDSLAMNVSFSGPRFVLARNDPTRARSLRTGGTRCRVKLPATTVERIEQLRCPGTD